MEEPILNAMQQARKQQWKLCYLSGRHFPKDSGDPSATRGERHMTRPAEVPQVACGVKALTHPSASGQSDLPSD